MFSRLLQAVFNSRSAASVASAPTTHLLASPVPAAAGRPCDQPPLSNEEMLARIGY